MMNALPRFAQVQPPPSGQAPVSSALPLLSSDSGAVGQFDALLRKNSAPSAQAMTDTIDQPTKDQPANSGQFQDVDVILHLLRSSHTDAAAAPTPDMSADDSAAIALPTPLAQQAEPVGPVGPNHQAMPAATPAVRVFPAAALNAASTQDVLDIAARLALSHTVPLNDAPATPVDSPPPQTTDSAMPSTPDLQAAMHKLIGDQPAANIITDAPSLAAPNAAQANKAQTNDAPMSDPATGDAPATAIPQQAEALQILLSLSVPPPATQASAAALGAAPSTPQGKAISLQNALGSGPQSSTLDSDDGSENLLSANPKPQPAWTAGATPPKAPMAQTPGDGPDAAPVLARATTPPLPSASIATPTPTTSAAPPTDMGAAMQAMVTTTSNSTAAAAPSVPAAEAAAVPDHWLDMSSDDAWIDQLAKDIAATKSLTGDLTFRLMPRHLGRLDVSMIQNDQGVSVRMDAQQENTAAIVAAAQGRLVDELRQQGVRVAGAETNHTPHDPARQQSQGQNHNNNGKVNINHLIETESKRLPESNSDEAGRTDRHGRFA